MTILTTRPNARSADFQVNTSAMHVLVACLQARIANAQNGGGDAARAKHTARGKSLARDRVQMLLDPGAPFLELSPLAAPGMYPERDGSHRAPA